jgi:hypothetical protein
MLLKVSFYLAQIVLRNVAGFARIYVPCEIIEVV